MVRVDVHDIDLYLRARILPPRRPALHEADDGAVDLRNENERVPIALS